MEDASAREIRSVLPPALDGAVRLMDFVGKLSALDPEPELWRLPPQPVNRRDRMPTPVMAPNAGFREFIIEVPLLGEAVVGRPGI